MEPVRPDDVALLRVPTGPTLRGDLLLVSVSAPDPEHNEYHSALQRIPLTGGAHRPWTWGTHDTAPTISPDGRWVAFLRRTGERERPQLHVMPSDGGDARCVTSAELGVGAPVWAPDSRRILCETRIPEPGRYGTKTDEWPDAPKPEAEAPRRITRMDYRLDDVGYLLDRHTRLIVVDLTGVLDATDAEAPEPIQLTDGRCDVQDATWTPDGTHVVFVAPRAMGAEESIRHDIVAVSAAGGGEPMLVARASSWAAYPAVAQDGTVVYIAAEHDGPGYSEAENAGLFAVPFGAEPGTPRRLTDVATVDCEAMAGRPIVIDGGVAVGVRHRGSIQLRRVPLDADNARLDDLPILAGQRGYVRSFTADRGRIAAVVSVPDSPGEVVLVENGTERTLTALAKPLQASGIRPLIELNGTAADGYPVHGWLVLPEGHGPHPVLLHIHGGPHMYHGWGFLDEAQVYASAGYAVVLPNPRGSSGYGQGHGKAIVKNLVTVDVDDVLATLDVALARPDCDAERVGVMGGSYGGFMTSWLAAHHGERFQAAWSERAVNAWDSFSGSSDIGWFFTDCYVGPDPAEQRRVSPLTYADRVRIPFAVVHSEQDLRCPFEQAQRMFVALRQSGVDAEMLVFPAESHELTRSGLPRHRVQRFRAVLDWWSRHLKA